MSVEELTMYSLKTAGFWLMKMVVMKEMSNKAEQSNTPVQGSNVCVLIR